MQDAAERPAVLTQKDAPARPYVVFEDGRNDGQALLFEEPEEIIVARAAKDVAAAFERMEAATRRGLYLAGYAGYELGYALEPKFAAQATPDAQTPLLLFGAFRAPRPWSLPPAESAGAEHSAFPCLDFRKEDTQRFNTCRDYIFAGDVYQINLTFPLYGRYDGDALSLYRGLRKRQPVVRPWSITRPSTVRRRSSSPPSEMQESRPSPIGLPSRVRATSPAPSKASRNRPRSRAPRWGRAVEERLELGRRAHPGAAEGAAVEGDDVARRRRGAPGGGCRRRTVWWST